MSHLNSDALIANAAGKWARVIAFANIKVNWICHAAFHGSPGTRRFP